MATRVTQHEDESGFEPIASSMGQAQKAGNGSRKSLVMTKETGLVEEVAGEGTSVGYEASEATLLDDGDNHDEVRSVVLVRTEADQEAVETSREESMFESVEGFDESALTEAGRESEESEEAVVDAFFAESGTEEFLPILGALVKPLATAVIPMLAQSIFKSGAKPPINPDLLRRLIALGKGALFPRLPLPPPRGRESTEGEEAGLEVDEAALEAQIQQLEVVIGPDDRIQVTNTMVVPWRHICHLKIRAANGKMFLGTGFFIGPRTIVTAGHCVYLHGMGGWPREIIVTPARNGDKEPFNKVTATSFRSVKGWVNHKAREYDYGAILLPRSSSVGKQTGSFGYGHFSDAFLRGKRLNTAGYPGDKPAGTMWFNGRNAKDIQARVITYDLDTAGGQSGSAVWILDRKTGKRTVVGIHTNGAAGGNSATRITKPVFDNLQKWHAEGGTA